MVSQTVMTVSLTFAALIFGTFAVMPKRAGEASGTIVTAQATKVTLATGRALSTVEPVDSSLVPRARTTFHPHFNEEDSPSSIPTTPSRSQAYEISVDHGKAGISGSNVKQAMYTLSNNVTVMKNVEDLFRFSGTFLAETDNYGVIAHIAYMMTTKNDKDPVYLEMCKNLRADSSLDCKKDSGMDWLDDLYVPTHRFYEFAHAYEQLSPEFKEEYKDMLQQDRNTVNAVLSNAGTDHVMLRSAGSDYGNTGGGETGSGKSAPAEIEALARLEGQLKAAIAKKAPKQAKKITEQIAAINARQDSPSSIPTTPSRLQDKAESSLAEVQTHKMEEMNAVESTGKSELEVNKAACDEGAEVQVIDANGNVDKYKVVTVLADGRLVLTKSGDPEVKLVLAAEKVLAMNYESCDQGKNSEQIDALEEKIKVAVVKGDYAEAASLKEKVEALKEGKNSIGALKEDMEAAAGKGDYAEAARLKKEIERLEAVEAPSSQELQDKKEIQRLQQELEASEEKLAASNGPSTARLEFTFKFKCEKYWVVKAMGGIIAKLVVKQSGKNTLQIQADNMAFDPNEVLTQNGKNDLEHLGFDRMADKRMATGADFPEAVELVADHVAKRFCKNLSRGSTPSTKKTSMIYYKNGQ